MSDSTTEESVIEEVKPKRTYRRRSTKAATEEASTEVAGSESSDTSNTEEEPKKKRATRTRKTTKKALETKAVQESEATEASPETPLTSSVQDKGTSTEAASPAKPEKKAASEVEGEKPARKRRVTRKTKDSEEKSSEKTQTAQAKDSSAENEAISSEGNVQIASGASDPSSERSGQAENSSASTQADEMAEKQGTSGDNASGDTAAKESTSHEGASEEVSARKQRNRKTRNEDSSDADDNHGGSRKQRNFSKNNHQKNASQQKGSHFRSRRAHQQNRRELIVPQTSKDDLAKLKVAELRARAEELEVDHKGLKKAELVETVFAASIKAEGFVETAGILDVLSDGYGFLRTHGYLPSEDDVYVGMATIRRNGLRKGDYITGQTRPARPNEKYAALQRVDTVNGIAFEELGKRVRFADLTPVFPDERLVLEHGKSTITARVIDLCAPIGKGQRGLIVSPPKAGKTTILKDIAASITANNPEVHLMCLLVDERPEEVTDMERSIHGEVISSTFDMPSENHIAVSELVIERAKRLVENGQDVVILLDSLTRLARAYNLAQPASGRILSGGVDSTALYPPKKFLGAARNIEGGGSLTILASALIETGSKMDEVIFEEFKGTGNMEVKLDRQLADRRIFPAIDPVASGTRREDLLIDPQEAPLIWAVRRILANRNNTERAMESLVKALQQTNNNQEFLIRAAKKAQGHHFEEGNIEF